MVRLFDCCWVELAGYPRAELVIQKKLKPRIFAIDEFLYDEFGNPLVQNPEAPRILMVHKGTIAPRRRA